MQSFIDKGGCIFLLITPKGAVYGFAQSIGQAGFNRFKNKSTLKNLYFASAWTFPGGGFEGAMRAGYKSAREISL